MKHWMELPAAAFECPMNHGSHISARPKFEMRRFRRRLRVSRSVWAPRRSTDLENGARRDPSQVQPGRG